MEDIHSKTNEFLLFCIIPGLYLLIIALAAIRSFRSKRNMKPKKLYHVCRRRNAEKLYSSKLFLARTEGLVFCSSNPKTSYLGEDSFSFRKIKLYIKLHKNYINQKNKRTYISQIRRDIKKKRKIIELFENRKNLITLVFSHKSISQFKPVFTLDVYLILKFWQAIKMLTNQWVTIKQGNLIIISGIRNGNVIHITNAEIIDKKGRAKYLAYTLRFGMLLFNSLFFCLFFSNLFFYFFIPNIDSLFNEALATCLIIMIVIIILWRIFCRKIHSLTER